MGCVDCDYGHFMILVYHFRYLVFLMKLFFENQEAESIQTEAFYRNLSLN